MADSASAQLEAYKAAATKSQAEIQYAATRIEALNLAIDAAENLFKAVRITSSPAEKAELKARCNSIMDIADRLKKTENWSPKPRPLADRTRSNNITAWATHVANQTGPALGVNAPTLPASSLDPRTTSTPPAPSSPQHVPGEPHQALCNGGLMLDRTSTSSPSALSNSFTQEPREAILQVHESDGHGGPKSWPSPPVAAEQKIALAKRTGGRYPNIKRLAEPVSSRKLTTRENIHLLKSSNVNDFKCPPWTTAPEESGFFSTKGGDLFTDSRDLGLSEYQQKFLLGWMRAKDALPPPNSSLTASPGSGPTMETSGSIDLVQDAATDCSVVASLCAGIARAECGHHDLLSTQVHPQHRGRPVLSTSGKYVVRLNFNGCWRKVVIDDKLPVSNSHRLLHVVDRHNPALLWPALLEKAYLKVRGGYDFPGSNSCGDIFAFTGWIPEQLYLQEADTVPHKLWERIFKAFQYGDVLLTLGTGKMEARQERDVGLEGQHSYAVLDMMETDEDKLLLIKNPWIEGKGWKGPRPLIPAAATEPQGGMNLHRSDSKPSTKNPYPATFWLGLDQVIQHFESLYVNWNPGLFFYREDIHFEWEIPGQPPPGTCIVKNPQFSFASKAKKEEEIWFLLSRHFRDAPDHDKRKSDNFNDGSVRPTSPDSALAVNEATKGYMSIYVCNGHGKRIYMKDMYYDSTPYVTTPQCLLRFKAAPNETYTVVIDQEDLPPSPYRFTLSAFSTERLSLEHAAESYEFTKEVRGEWTRETAGGVVGSVKYFQNPQWTLHLKERGSLAIMMTSNHESNPLHVKLVLGHGKRVYKLQSRDIIVDSGDHRTGCVLAQTRDLLPGIYTVICSLFDPGRTGDYTLRIDSTSHVALTPIPRDGAGLILNRIGTATFEPHVTKLVAPMYIHRLASFTALTHLLNTPNPQSRCPLRLSIESGRGPDRHFHIASENGEYVDAMTVRCESVNLDPMELAPVADDTWLVLHRIEGTARRPQPVTYDVEILTDVPNAFTLGVWREGPE
ncbi:cysteine proteinase [Corynespora cassiicola Philippines]|uniref:Cysteine proteinase n=1 Tax=Corynespora cassiicola Philippines TaxID=1448308 RepID=A0A2T2NBK0_CORCC|nr:cysteine proteinase [Corynespora cassiicola Philippines]